MNTNPDLPYCECNHVAVYRCEECNEHICMEHTHTFGGTHFKYCLNHGLAAEQEWMNEQIKRHKEETRAGLWDQPDKE